MSKQVSAFRIGVQTGLEFQPGSPAAIVAPEDQLE